MGLHYVGAQKISTEILMPVDMKHQWNELIKKAKKSLSSKEMEEQCAN
jgi:hypothetical protein